MGLEPEPLFQAWSYFRRRKFRQCADLCSQLLERPPGEQEPDSEYTVFQAAWSLKTRALTEMVYVDEIDIDQEGIAEIMLDENAIAQVARPGTSLKLPGTSQGGGPSPAVRPVTQSGRPITGFVRPSTQSGRPSTMEQAIKTPRTALTARPITSASGRYGRLGTASMITNPDGPFINLSRLNLAKYAQKPKLAKALFEYIFHHENDVKNEMNNISSAAEYYKDVLKQDNTHVEAIACIGSNHFYSDQPELALRFYRRLLQMGVYNCQLFNNLGLCCFYAQQYDMTLSSFERALFLAENEEETADVWYNLGHVAVGIGDLNLAYQCFRLTLVNNNDYAEAYNNLAVLEMRKGHIEQARALLQTASSLAPHMYEPHFNFAILSEKVGDLQRSYTAAQKSAEAFPGHVDTQELIKQLKQHFAML
ncbi:tetratricopeptide repeat protein 8 isoform X3 [Chroicocephalus ridibundus]|uniref:tetratricopeptide repeat protein 8 isoform X3 n=1 Tax=Chroicocephalus ridibundus TaxID=1192867 RepID=UPI002FDE2CB8